MAVFARLREVIEEVSVSAEVDRCRPNFARFDDSWEALKWLLARSAEKLGEAPSNLNDSHRLYVQEGEAEVGSPEIWVIFEMTANAVTIIAVNFVEAPLYELDE